jgi:hypothetical protein
MIGPTCIGCGNPVNALTGYRKVSGFERIRRPQGGTNSLRAREPANEYACPRCVNELASGIGLAQGELFEAG